jgi:eukaryotic-like serine/threonine-protein kinase
MGQFREFLRSPQLYLHLAIIVTGIVLGVWLILNWLNTYTGHGQFVQVPQFAGQMVRSLPTDMTAAKVKWQIIDSIYDPNEKPGIVLRQDPEAGTKVKENRMVYLYVTGLVPPQVLMPKLTDRSERQARLILNSYGLKAGNTTEKEADCNGCVIAQLRNGIEVAPGKPVKKGSVIDLVIGRKDPFFKNNDTLAGANN